MKRKAFAGLLALALILSFTGCSRGYEVRYELNGGTLVSGELLQKVGRGQNAVEPEVEKEGYKLVGWDKPSTGILDNMVIVAQWEKAFKIQFDPDGGTPEGKTVQYLVEGDDPAPPAVTKEHMDFVSWSPAVDSVSGDATYTAQWAVNDEKWLRQTVLPSVVEISTYDSKGEPDALGSGFFIDDKGSVVTNFHVMDEAYSAKITMNDSNTYDVKAVLGYNEELDLLLMEVDVSGNEYLERASQSLVVEPPDKIYAFGSPRGQSNTMTEGTISSDIQKIDGVEYIPHNAAISPGNSGGPLIHQSGKVIGVNTMSLKESQNMNYAVEISQLSQLDVSKRMTVEEFYDEVHPVPPNPDPVPDSNPTEMEPNNDWEDADELTLGEWKSATVSSDKDIDWFYIAIESSRRLTFEIAPNLIPDADKIYGAAFVYAGNGDDTNDMEDLNRLGTLTKTSDYSYTVEKVYVMDSAPAGIYLIAVIHDDDYSFESPYDYVVRVS